jgi:hypothetical protein
MPTHGGRSLAVRTRKLEIERRLGTVEREISTVRLRLRSSGFR